MADPDQPQLNISTLVVFPFIQIDEVKYPILNTDQLTVFDYHRFMHQDRRIDALLETPPPLKPADARELKAALDRRVNTIFLSNRKGKQVDLSDGSVATPAPPEVLATLSDMFKLVIYRRFTMARAMSLQLLEAMAQPTRDETPAPDESPDETMQQETAQDEASTGEN